LASQAPFNLGDEGFREAQVMKGLLQGLCDLLRLAAVPRETLLGLQVASVSGFGLFVGVSFGWGHGALLCTVVLP
jgi:hypothetical protein